MASTVSVGGIGQTLMSTGGGATWNNYSQPTSTISAQGKISLVGEKADIEINGKSFVKQLEDFKQTIDYISERLNILTVNEKLEAEWEDLAELGRQYRELEQKILAKSVTWDIISKK